MVADTAEAEVHPEAEDKMILTLTTMRKTALTLLLTFAAICTYAQNAYDGLLFSENNYEGTARSVAMGNAFTALGGDLGAVTINPAGSAVAGYSQITITPGLTMTSSTAQGVSPFADGSLPYFEKAMRSNMTRFSLPNLGFTLNWDTSRKSGLKNVTLGFIANRTASFDNDVYAKGTNSTTTFMGALAAGSDGYLAADLNANVAYDFMPWDAVVGYQSGMISTFGGYDDKYVGASELIFNNGDIVLGGPLEQTYGRRSIGGKYDYVLNMGANFSDFLYIGANLGLTTIDYNYDEYFKEAAIDPADFDIELDNGDHMYFSQMKYRYNYSAEGTGYYAKIGVIVTPGGGFRFGAAVQTPTVNAITETWSQRGETEFTSSQYNGYASSPDGEYSYTFQAPFRANLGIAYTLGNIAAISADYEVCDYSQMRFRGNNGSDKDYFEDVNNDIKERFGASHMFRAGAEVKLGLASARVGYGLTTSSEKIDTFGNKIPETYYQNVSFGFGYNSKKSFFADIAVRKNFAIAEYYMPYSDYIFDIDENGNEYIADPAPEILIRKSSWKVLLTLGWRF